MAFPDFEATAPVFARTLAERFGARELIVTHDRRMTYAEAETRSAHMARGLLAEGVGKGSRVALLMPNGPDWIVTWLAITRIGAIAVPLNTFFRFRELEWVLHHADVQHLLAVSGFLSHDYRERLEEAAPALAHASAATPLRLPNLPCLRSIHLLGECDRPWAKPAEALQASTVDAALLAAVEASVTPADAMMILYSSGSTADPKGVVHTHGTILRHSHNLLAMRDIDEDDRVWSPMPFFWVGGLVYAFLGTMHSGACLLCEEVFDPESTLAFIEGERASVLLGWPHFGKALAEHPSASERDLGCLRKGNMPDILPASLVPADPELRPNALGMTETCGPHTWCRDGALPEALRGSFGSAVAGVEHKVVDPESGERLPPGELGEICVRGYSLMQGLYKVEREEVFDDEGFYHTGDGGYFDRGGVLYFKGRLGDMIKTAGANVTPSEIEQVVVAYPEVKAAYVVGVPDEERGQSVAAAVVLEPGQITDPGALRARLKREISAYKVPRHIFVQSEHELPFTDTGKIDKQRLTLLLSERIQGGE
ncbi:MAG: acyl--CoA ligase [Deltaproteobacteria bacterium]|nr:acyl--CoA ligase [Deltaproteobacteria bacterium]